MRRSHAMILLATLASMTPPSDPIDFTGIDPRHEDRVGPKPRGYGWFHEPGMSAAELVRRAAAKRRSKHTHRSKRGQRKRF